jgi:SPP1 family predicted phage head-tail adaptor
MANKSQAGLLDRTVTFQQNTRTQTSSGAYTDSWSTLATEQAERVPRAGTESFGADQLSAMADVLYRIRYRDDVGPGKRLLDGSTVYDIVACDEEGRRQWLLVYCKAPRIT